MSMADTTQERIVEYVTSLCYQVTHGELTIEEATIDVTNDISTGKRIVIRICAQEFQPQLTVTTKGEIE